VQLIACRTCHAQYDVEQIGASRFACRCGETLENRPAESRDAPVLRCGSCGAALATDAGSCSFCGSAVVRRPSAAGPVCPECFARTPEGSRFCTACGVAFRPEPLHPETRELPCPACSAPMGAHAVAGIGLNACGSCGGLWVPEGRLEDLLARARESQPAAAPSEAPTARVRGGNPARQRVEYRRCPECDASMLRHNFQRRSGIIVDVCQAHGSWLDADELEQIAGFLRSRPRDAALVAGRGPEPAAAERGPAEAAFVRILAENRALGPRPEPPAPSTLLDMLFSLLR
jgi:Zn-finger nucleic acid-binding protein